LNSRVVIALGSNEGERAAHLAFAVERLQRLLDGVRVSRTIATPPAPPAAPTDPPYLNAVVVGATESSAREVLDGLLAIERARGRTRPHAGAPRTLDLDLILFGDQTIQEKGLEVPHPRFRERRFVLEPLAELAPDLVDPVTGLTVRQLLARLPGA
jgi:2-amino-4-hydroxy-6-hydroxymethyldihydropteridine diphosphokinase